MVGALDRALRDSLQTQGLRDPNVTILDPAVGTGTFLLGIAQRVRDEEVRAGEGMAALALRNLAYRMFGFELLVGPYAVAHYRLHHSLQSTVLEGQRAEVVHLPRLGIYLTDTLAEPGAAAPAGPLGFVSEGIADERHEANRIKSEQPILAIIGNPPYRRLEEGENRTLVGNWMDALWDDLKEPVRNAGHGNQLNTFPELSVAFWRWAIWKLFESENAPRRGVVAFITNRKFLTGWPYAGLRQMLRQRFDRIEIFDLRGDVRRGERAGVEADQGVFNIQVGTAITVAIADGSRRDGQAADVFYHDSWTERLFTRRAKFERLRERSAIGAMPDPIPVERDLLDDMRPEPFQNAYWISLREIFAFSKSGMKSGNDDVFTCPIRQQLRRLVTAHLGNNVEYNESLETYYSYRPLDRRWFYDDLSLLDRPGPEMQRVWGNDNVGLYALPSGTAAGPAVWCHGLIPDYHAFRGSYGGYAFPLYDRRPSINAPNIRTALIEGLSAAYGEAISPEDIFDGILCLLSAASYTLRFAEDLEDAFPHIPFPTDYAVFRSATHIGREIRAVETFAREPLGLERPDFVRVETQPRGNVEATEAIGESLALCADGSGHVTGVPQRVSSFGVSGYRVLSRWLEARKGLPADLGFVRELRDICGRIAELIDLFVEADKVLDAALRETLSREALNLGDIQPD